MKFRPPIVPIALAALVLASTAADTGPKGAGAPPPADELFVDPHDGKDRFEGTRRRPLRSISAALARVPDPVRQTVTIHLASGTYATTGAVDMPADSLHLWRRMAPGVDVRLVGPEQGEPAILAWNGERRMIEVREGAWHLARVQVGSFSTEQRRGVQVRGPASVVLEDVTFRLRSHSDGGIWARDGGRVRLRGAIRLNEHLAEEAEDETFCGVIATDHGVVEFDERRGSSLVLGNGSLSAGYYGSIRLGCEEARVTCWTKSNNLTINNGGRIDLRNTPTVLRARLPNNVPIGLEHDGHILAEDAHIRIVGPNEGAIALQKASTFTCNDIELVGEFDYACWAMSGSMFVGRFLGDVPRLEASTGAGIHVEKIGGKLVGQPTAKSGGLISLPDRTLRSE